MTAVIARPILCCLAPTLAAGVLALVLGGCAAAPPGAVVGDVEQSWSAQSGPHHVSDAAAATGWEHKTYPAKTPTEYRYGHKDGRVAVAVHARSSASMLRSAVRVPAAELGALRFSWLVPQLNPRADVGDRERDDSVVRIVLAFDGDRSRFSAKDAMLSELSRALTGEELPYATLVYIWSNKRAPGTVVIHPRTDRVRKLVVESGPLNLNRWQDYQRDVRADFERAFGEPPGDLVAIGIMTDSDNTRADIKAWYGPVRLVSRQ